MLICSRSLLALERQACSLSVIFVTAKKMQALNRQYRGKDHATDVLSFSYPGETDDDLCFLGEIVISPEIASENALRWNTSPEREIRKLLVHAILHLLGYDHEIDHGEMILLQRQLLRRRSLHDAESILSQG